MVAYDGGGDPGDPSAMATATFILDLVKVVERVQALVVWRRGARCQFSAGVVGYGAHDLRFREAPQCG
eukprot:10263139-Lingulodinium_polyedra.AAC.1